MEVTLEVSQTTGQIGVKQEYATLKVEAKPGRLGLNSPPVILDLNLSWPQIKIDMRQVYSEIGLKNYLEAIREGAADGRQTALKGIARRAREGDRLAAIAEGPGAIPEIAWQNHRARGQVQTNIGLIPRSRPEIEVTPGRLDVRNKYRPPTVKYLPGSVQTHVQKGYVDVYLVKTPELDISVHGN